jgi:HEAT repeat protein
MGMQNQRSKWRDKSMIEQVRTYRKTVPSEKAIPSLVNVLSSTNGVKRHAAREQLEEIGTPAVPFLIKALQSPSEHARWEAAKALNKIADVRAAKALVHTLEDEKGAVRWLAATALVNLGRSALVPLLRGLEGHSDSIWFRDGAHHVLRSLVREGVADEAVPVLEALENLEPRIEAPIAAYHVLEELRGRKETGAELAQ